MIERKCKVGVSKQILVGLQRVGLMGLGEAFQDADESGLVDQEAIVDLLLETLSKHEYIPASQAGNYREALWREYKRHRGEDISDLYSKVEVVVRGEPGEELDGFVELLKSSMTGGVVERYPFDSSRICT